jgi:hypothetical protein
MGVYTLFTCVFFIKTNFLTFASYIIHKETNSVALVCEQTIPTEWRQLIEEVSANFCG